MEQELLIDLYSIGLGVIVNVSVSYLVHHDSDPVEVGERTVWRKYTETEIVSITAMLNGETYTPTEEDLGAWSSDISFEIDKQIDRTAA